MDAIRDVMTKNPDCFEADRPVIEAAYKMRDDNIGDVIITKGGRLFGILTDRDIVVRCIATDKDARSCTCGDVCSSKDLVTLSPDDNVEQAVRLMREHALRRLIVVENDEPVGIVSIGDLAQKRDRRSALGEISSAPPNL